ncbi:MAG TPA: AAA-associated domain-containing protein, partial [Casimicrobiaceae bacterium]|nr:AAA-associated domain-containing protein [Casimicrobiaceae bacterium]
EPFRGRADLPMLAEESGLDDKELLDVTTAMTLLGFAHLDGGDIILTPLGHDFAQADQGERKAIFGHQLRENVPLVAYIRHGLDQDPSGDLPEQMFLKLLSYTLTESEAEAALRVAVEWGRYGDLFAYNYNTGVIHLPDAAEAAAK